MAQTLENLIGQKLVIGFPGTRLTPEVAAHFRQIHAGGVIFYRINFESPQQLCKLITDLENALGQRLLVCVDHEGGRVIMYRDGVTIFPDNMAVGKTGQIEYAEKMGRIAARELRALGTDVNFAPVLDVLTSSYSPNIGIRSFGENWKDVADMGAAYISALQKGGVSATAKHFPGKGHAPVDAHLKLPTIPSTWDDMQKVHLQPFLKAIDVGVDVIMSSHPLYPRLDPGPGNIATFSRRIIFDYLRQELNYKGVISSDDLEMGAIRDICSIDGAAVKTVAAGHDLILSCHDMLSQKKIFQGLLDAYKAKFLPLNELEESVERIQQLKAKRPKRFEGIPGRDPEGEKWAQKMAQEAVQVVQNSEKIIPLSHALSQDAGVLFPQLSSFAPKIMIEKEFEDEISFLHHKLGPYPGNHVIEIYKIEPDDEDIDVAANLARRSTVTLFFCFDAHLYPGQQKLFAALQGTARKLVVIFMRDPYDKTFLRSKDAGITAFGFRRCQIEAVIRSIYGDQ